MAWNEPGGNRNNDRDPWSSGNRGGNDQGPPDLDEALKKGLDKLNKLFGNKGGSGGSGGSGGGKSPSGGGFTLILACLFSGFWRISQSTSLTSVRTASCCALASTTKRPCRA